MTTQSVKSVPLDDGIPPKKLYIEVHGSTGSGKTLIQQLIAKALRDHGVSYTIDWGPDGNPCRPDEFIVDTLKKNHDRFDVEITAIPLRRDGTKMREAR